MPRTKQRTNPLFRPDDFRLVAGSERAEKALTDPDSIDLLVWNVFSTLDTHSDPAWLAGRMEMLVGAGVRAPVRMSLWTGAEREPLLHPPASYIAAVRTRAERAGGDAASLTEFGEPVAVPVRVDSPDVIGLIDAVGATSAVGRGGRDRLVELIDVGLEQARRLGKTLGVGVLYRSGTNAATEVSGRLNALRTTKNLAAALPHRSTVPPVALREMSWQQLLKIWQSELDYLDVDGLPVKQFLGHCRDRGLM